MSLNDMEKLAEKTFRFGPFLLEVGEHRLTRNGLPLRLTVKEFELLSLLVEQPGRLLTKDEIFSRLWPDLRVDESNLNQTIYKLRTYLKDNGRSQYIQTVQKRGYRFAAPVQVVGDARSEFEYQQGGHRLRKYALVAVLILAVGAVLAYLIGERRPADRSSGHYVRGLHLEREGKDAEARAEYDAAFAEGLQADQARLRAAWLAYQDFDNDAALQYLPPLFGSKSADQQLFAEARAIEQASKGHTEDAILTLKQLTSSHSSNVDGWYFLADISLDVGDFEDSEKALSRCLALSPADPLCTYDRLLLWQKTNRFQESISGYRNALNSGINYPWIEEAAGYAELGVGNLEGARRHFDHLSALKYQDPHGYAFQTARDGMAAIALYTGKIGAARERLNSALETSHSKYERASYELTLSQLDALLGRATDAQKEAALAVKDSSAGDIAMGAAEALAMAGDFATANELLTKREGEGPALGRRYAAVREFVRALEALKFHRWEQATDLLTNSSDSGTLALYYLETAQIAQHNWAATNEVSRQILSRRGEILHDGLPIILPVSEYRLGICERHLGQVTSGNVRIAKVEELWHSADQEAKTLLDLGR